MKKKKKKEKGKRALTTKIHQKQGVKQDTQRKTEKTETKEKNERLSKNSKRFLTQMIKLCKYLFALTKLNIETL